MMENPIKMDDLGVPLFSETSILTNPRIVEFLSRFIGMTLRTQQSLQVSVAGHLQDRE